MACRVEFLPRADKQLRALAHLVQARIVRAVRNLADNPRPPGCAKLTGTDDLWRIRVGDYRVIYHIQDADLLVLVVRIGHRRDVYKGNK
jgi:mRNA interferase RelE/StbE